MPNCKEAHFEYLSTMKLLLFWFNYFLLTFFFWSNFWFMHVVREKGSIENTYFRYFTSKMDIFWCFVFLKYSKYILFLFSKEKIFKLNIGNWRNVVPWHEEHQKSVFSFSLRAHNMWLSPRFFVDDFLSFFFFISR